MKLTKYYLAAFSAFFIWGFFSLALKPIADFPSLDILFYRVFFSVLFLTLLNVVFRKRVILENWAVYKNFNPKQKRTIIVLTCGGSMILASNWFLFIYVVNHISVKAGSLAYLICPILTTVFAFILLKESLSRTQWSAVLLSILSCLLLMFNNWHDVLYSLVVASTYAFYLVSQRKNHQIDKLLVLNVQLLFISLLIAPFYPSFSGPLPTSILFYACLLVIVVVFTIVPLFLNLYALKGIPSAAVGILMYINPIINFALALFYFNEKVTVIPLISYGLILISIVIFNKKVIFEMLRKSKEKRLVV
ncbi:MAG: EamA family transporter [Flavobacterium sp.]